MNGYHFNSVVFICVAVVAAVALTQCGVRTDPAEVKAVSEACVKVGKEPKIYVGNGRIEMGCAPQPASSGVR